MKELFSKVKQEAAERLKAERRAKKKAEKEELAKLTKQRREKEVNLNGLTNLSGKTITAASAIKCYSCGGPHKKSDCPNLKRRHGGRDDGPPRKHFKSS